MAKDMSDTVRDALGQVVRGALKNATQTATQSGGGKNPLKRSKGPFSGIKGVAAGAGLAAAAPIAYKGVDKLRTGGIPKPSASGLASKAGDQLSSKLKDTVSEKVDQAGGAGGIAKEAAGSLIPGLGGGGNGGGGGGGAPGVGKGRRMPVQQYVDVAVPLETAYNQWTQFEDWPNFMHRVTNVTQDDDCTVSFSTKIWTRKREFTANIETQRPDERIKWKVSQGITHTGVVTFHELAPRLTRIELTFDVTPGGMIEKAARGMRNIKRAARADLHRFKAFIEMQELETGAWRGVIEDGEVVEEHDPSYDEEREYTDIEDVVEDEDSDDDADSDDEPRAESDDEDQDEESDDDSDDDSQRARTGRFQRQAQASRSSSSRSVSDDASDSKKSSNGGKSKASSSSKSSGRSRSANGSSGSGSSSRKRSSGNGSSSSRRTASSRS
jgi:uncharacterized membrane protein